MVNSSILQFQAKVFKALGHPSRLLIVQALRQGERCVCELQELLDANMPSVSKHLGVLKEAGIVEDERRGTNIYYSLKMTCVSSFTTCVEKALGKRLEEQVKALNELKAAAGE